MRRLFGLFWFLVLSACAIGPVPQVQRQPVPVPVLGASGRVPAEIAARNFVFVVAAMEPVVERECFQRNPGVGCDFQIVVDDRPGQPPNAFQTLDQAGRPIIAFTLALIGEARNVNELAFIMGHEASHHILAHIPKTEESAIMGALVMGALASLGGGSQASVQAAQQMGASVGARRFSKGFELEADQLGTVIAFDAGFDPEQGAGFFDRLPDPGNTFLGTHPPNADRIQMVRQTLLQIRGY